MKELCCLPLSSVSGSEKNQFWCVWSGSEPAVWLNHSRHSKWRPFAFTHACSHVWCWIHRWCPQEYGPRCQWACASASQLYIYIHYVPKKVSHFFIFFLSYLGWHMLPSRARPASQAGLMRNPREGTSVMLWHHQANLMVCVVCSCCTTSCYRNVCRAKGGIGSEETSCHDIYPARPITTVSLGTNTYCLMDSHSSCAPRTVSPRFNVAVCVNRAIDDWPGIQQEAICYQWFKQRLILSVSRPSISQRSQIKEDTSGCPII